MPAVDGSAFVVYQGASSLRASRSAGWWPAAAYQQTATAWQASMNGAVRSTAAAVRLRALAGAVDLLRILDRDFNRPSGSVSFDYLSDIRAWLGGDEGEVVPSFLPVADEDDGDGPGAGDGVPQAGERGGRDGLGLSVAGDRGLREYCAVGDLRQGREPVALQPGPSSPPGPLRRQPVEGGVRAEPGRPALAGSNQGSTSGEVSNLTAASTRRRTLNSGHLQGRRAATTAAQRRISPPRSLAIAPQRPLHPSRHRNRFPTAAPERIRTL
jgi:hypothetical protein